VTPAERDRLDDFEAQVDRVLAEVAASVAAPVCPHGGTPAVCVACDDEARDDAGYRKWDETREMGAGL
jgi:hypothetical protein